MRSVKLFCQTVRGTNRWIGKHAGYLVLPMVAFVTLEVILRYVFNNPTIWAWDINVQILGAILLLGGGFRLLERSHISADVFAERLSRRNRMVLTLVVSPIFFLGMGVMTWQLALEAWNSLVTGETMSTLFHPPLYPLKFVLAFSALLLLLQGIANVIDDIDLLRSGTTNRQ